jgi:hypothetical protein
MSNATTEREWLTKTIKSEPAAAHAARIRRARTAATLMARTTADDRTKHMMWRRRANHCTETLAALGLDYS